MNGEVKFFVKFQNQYIFFFFGGGGGGRVRSGVMVDVNREVKDGCECRIEVFVKIQKKDIVFFFFFFFFFGGGGGVGLGGSG